MSWGCTISPAELGWDYDRSHRAVWGLYDRSQQALLGRYNGPNKIFGTVCQSHRGVYHCSVGLSHEGDCATLLAGTVGCETRTSVGLCVWVATTDRIEMVRQLC